MSRLNLRKRPRISYYEPEEPSLDEYVFCSDCKDYVYEYCSIHGPLLVIPDDKIYDRNNKRSHVVDAKDANRSNWMRYVNCSRHWFEQNLVAFQYKGELYYRTIKIIPRFTELMVFYGGEFANMLQINLRRYNSPAGFAQKLGAAPNKSDKGKRTFKTLPAKEQKCNSFIPPAINESKRLKNNEQKKIEEKCNNAYINIDTIIKSSYNDKAIDNNIHSMKIIKNDEINRNGIDNPSGIKKSIHKKVQKSKKLTVDQELNNNLINNKENVSVKKNSKDNNFVTKHLNNSIQKVTEIVGENAEYTQSDQCIKNNTIYNKGRVIQIVSREEIERMQIDLSCGLCEYKAKTKKILEKHLLLHCDSVNGKNIQSCNICQYKCITSSKLRDHMKTHAGEKPYSCSVCQYKCIRSDALRRHMKTHTGEKPYSCSVCQYKCITSSMLRDHMKTHTGEKPYSCSICKYKCIQSGNLRDHMKTHTGEKPYSCSVCQYKCIRSGNLRSHMRTHTGEKPYSCSVCQYKCIRSDALRSHMKTHTGEKPYSCSVCQYKCIQSGALRSHMKTHTG